MTEPSSCALTTPIFQAALSKPLGLVVDETALSYPKLQVSAESGHSALDVSPSDISFLAVTSQPINWAGQSPGAPKVLGVPSNFVDLKNTKLQIQ